MRLLDTKIAVGFVLVLLCANVHVGVGQRRQLVPRQTSWLSVARDVIEGLLEGFGFLASDRIIGGSEVASMSDRPYMAFIAYHPVGSVLRKKIKVAFCSATILTTTKVLTGASCFSIIENGDFSVYVGSLKPFKNKPIGATQVEIQSKALYDYSGTSYSFSSNPFYHDLAVVTTATSLTFSANINSIAMPDSASTAVTVNYGGRAVTSVGYGLSQDVDLLNADVASLVPQLIKPIINQRLRYVDQTGWTDAQCVNLVTSYVGQYGALAAIVATVCNELLLVQGSNGGGTCLFDNGGPMVVDGKVVGVMSVVLACSNSSTASIGNELSGNHWTWVKSQL